MVFWANHSFLQKNERISDSLNNLVSDLSDKLTALIFGERPEQFAPIAHYKRGMSESLSFLTNLAFIKLTKNKILDFFSQNFFSICHERPERFAHGSSFVLSNLRDSLTVAHLSWLIWANRSKLLFDLSKMSEISKLANERIPSPAVIDLNHFQ